MLHSFRLSQRDIGSLSSENLLPETGAISAPEPSPSCSAPVADIEHASSAQALSSSTSSSMSGSAIKFVSERVASKVIDKVTGMAMSAADEHSLVDSARANHGNATVGGIVKRVAKAGAGLVVSYAPGPRVVAATAGALVGNLASGQKNAYHTMIDMTAAATYTLLAPVITPVGAGIVTGSATGVLKHPVVEEEVSEVSRACAETLDEINGYAAPYLPAPSGSDEAEYDANDAFMGLGPGI